MLYLSSMMWLLFKIMCIICLMNDTTTLFDFNKDTAIDAWRVVNDGVMGGLSQGKFSINSDGHGLFQGKVSLENYGGFSSVRYRFDTIDTKGFSKVKLRLKGDGKRNQFRIKETSSQRYSYIANIKTSGYWEPIVVQFSEMHPAFRGRMLDLSNFSGNEMVEIAFLVGNKKEEAFALEIDYIELQ